MKKWIAFMLVLFLSVVAIGCGGGGEDEPGKTPGGEQTETVKPTDITLGDTKEEITVGEEFTITTEVTPSNATNKNVRVTANPAGIVEISTKTIKGVAEGEVTITVTAVGDTTVKKEFKLVVKPAPVVVVDPESFTVSAAKTEVEVGKALPLSVTALPENASKAATWTSSDESIATVNASNGMVLGKAEGKVTITATSTRVPTVSASIEITVIPAEEVIVDIQPTGITVTLSSSEVEVGYSVTARATVEPNGASQNVTWESRKPEVATIDANGRITAVSEGTTYITAYSAVDPSVKSTRVKLEVVAPAPSLPAADLQGYTIVLMNAESAVHELDPFNEKYAGSDKMFKQQAWNEVKKDFNCNIEVHAYPADASWGDSRVNWINSQAELGQAQADFYVVPTYWLYRFASVGSAHDSAAYYQKYGKNQMDMTQKAAATYKGGMYALSIGTDESKNYANIAFYYNLAWVERLKVDTPAKLFNEGKWTYSGFTNWANSVQAMLGEGEVAISGSLYYMWLGMTNTTGVKIANTASVEVTLNHPRSIAAAELLQGLVATGALATTSSWAETSGEFHEAKSVMTAGDWSFMKSDSRWAVDLFGEDTRFGYVPFPYPDDMSKDNIRVTEYGSTLLMTAAGRENNHTAGVTYEGIYQAMTTYYLKAKEYYTKDPSYDPETIKRNIITNKVDDPESVEAAMFWDSSKVQYDAVQDFFTSTSGSPIPAKINAIVKGTTEYQQAMDELETSYVQLFLSIYSS